MTIADINPETTSPLAITVTPSQWETVASFYAAGDPKGQPRPRAFARRMGSKFVARVYDSGSAEGWKSCIAEAARPHLPRIPWWQPIKVVMRFDMPRPKSHYRTGRNAGELKLGAPVWHTAKPDADNLQKAVQDALTVLGMWKDDGQVASCAVTKCYAAHGGVQVCVMVME